MAEGKEPVHLRALVEADLPRAAALAAEVGWPHRLPDWAISLRLGEGVVLEEAGVIVATSMGWAIGEGIASLGLVIVAPSAQGRGLGRRVVTAMLARLAAPTMLLHATAAGRPLYEKLGFEARGVIEQHNGTATPQGLPQPGPGEVVRPAVAADKPAIAALDTAATGLQRGNLLGAILDVGGGVILERNGVPVGYALCRAAGRGHTAGPVIAPDEASARLLIAYWISANAGRFLRLDIDADSDLATWATSQGLAGVGSATVMWRGAVPAGDGHSRRFSLISQAMG